jgi:hypothetical protein
LPRRTAFNVGMFALSTAAAGGAYILAGGAIPWAPYSPNVLALVAAVAADYVVNLGLLVGVISLQTDRSPLTVWRQEFSWGLPLALLATFGGSAMLATGYRLAGVLGVAAFVMPVLLVRIAYRLYVDRTKGMRQALQAVGLTIESVASNLSDAWQTLEGLAQATDTEAGEPRGAGTQLKITALEVLDRLAAESGRLDVLRDDLLNAKDGSV